MSSLNHFSPIQTTTPLTETPFLTESALNERQVLLKFVLIGDSSTGKTTIINKFLKNEFIATYRPTSINNYNPSSDEIIINCNDNNINNNNKKYIIQLQLWDTSGIFPSNISIPSTIHESSLASKKHPKSCHSHAINLHQSATTNNVNKNNLNNCIQSKTENCKSFHSFLPNNPNIDPFDMDLPLFFDEMDAKETMEKNLSPKPKHNNNNNNNNNNNKDGYSSSSSMDHTIDDSLINFQLQEKQILSGKHKCFSDKNRNKNKYDFDELIFNNLDALILVYDITNIQSLKNLNGWLELFAQNTINSNELPILIIGNKTDLILQTDGPNKTIPNYIRQGKIFTQQLCNPKKLFKSISAKKYTQNDIKSIFIQLANMCINTQSSILQLTSADSISSLSSATNNQRKTTYKRMQRSNQFAVNTCAHNFCGNNKTDNTTDDHTFCIIL